MRRKSPAPAPGKSKDRHTQPRFTFHPERRVLDALDAYCASFPHQPTRSQVVRDALETFLRDRGFLPPEGAG